MSTSIKGHRSHNGTKASKSADHRAVAPNARRLVLVDIENLVGGMVANVEQARVVKAAVVRAIDLRADEQVIVASCHLGAVSAGLGWSKSRLLVQSGPDGADLALLEVIATENLAARFTEVVLVSGDGIFTQAVAALTNAGARVTLVALAGHCSRALALAAHETIRLPEFGWMTTPHAA